MYARKPVLLAFSLPLLAIDGVAVNVTTGKPQAGRRY